ncbi:hypothetical protein [Histophilus somni]|uniref:Uncharacterized protein n=1 Tax=Histophilus somni TaxID=731 RepID=A0AAX2RY19_HISSO|nr:hypothetical protein [Histophilus somni]TDF40330.1 hypothetical protein E1290_05750 [Histophilus somni]TEW28875.1 hypothetical protein E2R48_08250 [Histophilus somni]TFF01056.1 hypothetical protein E3U35_08220 [Histophilus somni]THA21836.1 hypothetical protein E5361_04255 [Histophilus somni]THA90869.1 hypothetical protein E6A58_08195 [Histophilus somni]
MAQQRNFLSSFWYIVLGGRRTNFKTKLKRLFSLFVIVCLGILLAYCSDKTKGTAVMNVQTMSYFS